jgi:hypothetical protein
MRAQNLLIPLLAASCLLAQEKTAQGKDEEAKQKIEQTKTERVDFPAGGLLRLKHSIGDLSIEAWDNPNVEITTIKSMKEEYSGRDRGKASGELEKVTITTERHGDELVIATSFPRHRGFPFPWSGATNFNLAYRISVPRNARLAIDHDVGAVNVDGVAGDIEAKLLQGEIMLHLPEDAQYSINAQTDYGNVNSDFPGEKRRRWVRQTAVHEVPRPARILNLRVGYGDIVLLKIHTPKTPEPAAVTPGRSGL